MNRYFPELVAPLAVTLPERCVLDGEIVIVGSSRLDFEALLLRIRPAMRQRFRGSSLGWTGVTVRVLGMVSARQNWPILHEVTASRL